MTAKSVCDMHGLPCTELHSGIWPESLLSGLGKPRTWTEAPLMPDESIGMSGAADTPQVSDRDIDLILLACREVGPQTGQKAEWLVAEVRRLRVDRDRWKAACEYHYADLMALMRGR